MAILPKVQVFNKTNPVKTRPGVSSKIAVIGAFDSTDTDPVKQCQAGCTTSGKTNYNYGSKICITACGSDKFTDSSGIICYNSCKEIPYGHHIYEAANTKVCYTKTEIEATTPPTDCSFYYQRLDGTWKCIQSSSTCKQNGYDYLYEKECKRERTI